MAAVAAHGGYREATVDRVLEQARVGWGEFNRQFADLDACFLTAIEAGFDCAAAEVATAHDGGASPDAATRLALDRLLELVSRNPEIAHLCLVESAALGARAIEVKEQGLQRFVEMLERQLTPRSGSAATLIAEMIAGGVYEVLQRKARSGELRDRRQTAADLRQVWAPLIRAGQRPAD